MRAVDPPTEPVPIAGSPPPPPQTVYVPQKPTIGDQLHAAFVAIARILAVRFQLLLSLIGAFVLAVLAMQWQSAAGLYVLVAFCAGAVAPLVWLEFSGRRR
ncbi:MAG TPA: hypothetical protein VN663_22955 [Ramlibacter sp.]|nr:hypothetical protein [Ramlibacter sp.]